MTRAAPAPRLHGPPPAAAALLHGGPGAAGEMAPVAQELAARGCSVLEPWQSERSVAGQLRELHAQMASACPRPVALAGFSWGALLACLFAARHPGLVSKLVLIGSPPFTAEYAAGIEAARKARLRPGEWQELRALFADGAVDTEAGLERTLQLLEKAEAYAPRRGSPAKISFDRSIFEHVWPEAAALRRSGALLREAARLRCPVLAIHGSHDPHPAAGVARPLQKILPDFSLCLLQRCGHKPWIEQHAREDFFQTLGSALSAN